MKSITLLEVLPPPKWFLHVCEKTRKLETAEHPNETGGQVPCVEGHIVLRSGVLALLSQKRRWLIDWNFKPFHKRKTHAKTNILSRFN